MLHILPKEALFNPSLIGKEEDGIHDQVYKVRYRDLCACTS